MCWERSVLRTRPAPSIPAEVPDSVVTRVRARAALAKLPAEYRAIPANAGDRAR